MKRSFCPELLSNPEQEGPVCYLRALNTNPKKASAMLYNLEYWIPINNSTANRTKRKFLHLNGGGGREMINTPSSLKGHDEVH